MTVSGSPMSLSRQLREYDPCLGICSFRSSKCGCFYCDKASTPPGFPFPCNYSSHSKKFLRFKLLGTNSSYSSSSVTNDRGDLAGASFVSDGNSGQDTSQGSVLSDCLSAAENGRVPQSEELTLVAGGIVALGKFDALHIGHRELAIQAAKIGVPFLLSFVGMAEILGWEPRAPVVAKCDRKRVLSSWAPLCGNIIPKEFHIEFSKVRHLTPQQFVEKLSKELGVYGVVAGQNYRFGYRAAGNASDLVRLCEEYGMRACIITSVMDQNQESRDMDYGNSKEHGQVSSTRVRYALAKGDMKYVSELLGRHHRLILVFKDKENFSGDRKWLSAPRSWLLNLAPKEGLYKHCSIVTGEESVVPCRVIIDTADIHLRLDESAPCTNIAGQNLLSIEFGDSNV